MSHPERYGEGMRFLFRNRGIRNNPELMEFARRRIGFALGRFAGRIRTVSVRVTDVNGPRGGCDKACVVTVDAASPRPITVEERQPKLFAAVALAADRAGRATVRQFNRARRAA